MGTKQVNKTIKKVEASVKDLRRKPYGPNTTKNLKQRAILKDGEYNIIQPKFPWRYLRYVKDAFTSLVDAEWKWTIQVMIMGFTGCWLSFGLLWWLIIFVHNDLHEDHLPAKQAQNGWKPCILNIYGFHSCFLYSLETQSTMGYGLRVVTEECPEAIFLLCAQCIIGTLIDSFTVGVIFAKLTRPRMTAYTVQFSKNAVICMRDEEYCVMVRIGDLRKSKLIGVNVKAFLIHNLTTKEGENFINYETELEIQCDDVGTEPIFIWPITVIHKINESSPFYRFSAKEMLKEKFEMIVILDATVESTGQSIHAKTSYLENEILWGQTFENILCYNERMEYYEVNYTNFDKIRATPMLACSSAEFSLINCDNTKKANFYSSDIGTGGNLKKRNFFKNVVNEKENIDIITSDYEQPTNTPKFPVDWV